LKFEDASKSWRIFRGVGAWDDRKRENLSMGKRGDWRPSTLPGTLKKT
jgi:hypothetical protein